MNLKKIGTALRIAVGGILIAYLLIRLDLRVVLRNITVLDLHYLALAFGCYLLFIIVSAWRWQVLLDHKRIRLPFPKTNVIYFISLFFTNFLPTTVGGDVMRVVYSAPPERKADAVATVLADRILGFIGLFLFGLTAVMYLFITQHRGEFLTLMIVGLVGLILLTVFLFSKRAYHVASPLLERLTLLRLGERLSRVHRALNDFGGSLSRIAICVGQSVLIQVLLALSPFLILRGLGDQHTGLLPFFIYVPIINVISMIPVSLNGLGIRENSYVLLFARAGLGRETAVTVSLVSAFLVFLWSLVGGLLFMGYRKRNA